MAGAAEPRYAAIKAHILDGIAAGRLRPGDRLPSEHAFGEMFEVSRMTVNRALRELKQDGVLVGVAGVGSFIAEPKPQGHLIELRNIADEVRGRGHAYSATVVANERTRATRAAAARLDVEPGTPIFHSVIVHRENGAAIQLEDRLVLAAAAPAYGSIDFTVTTPYEYLMRAAPLERVDHRVRAELPPARTRALLDMPADEPCLLLIRRTWSGGRIVTYAELSHPASRFEFSDSFTPR